MKKITLILSIFTLFFTFSVIQINGQCSLGTNRIANGDAEGNPGETGNVDVANWENETNGFTVVQYAATDGAGIPGPNSPGPTLAERGNYLFYGGNSSNDSRADQDISLTDCATEIDAGTLRFDLSGYFGGYQTQNDRAVLTVTFLDAGGGILRTIVIGDITAAERSNVTGMVYQGRKGLVPAGTRSVTVDLFLDRTGGGNNNGYADNLQLILNAPSNVCSIGTNFLVNNDAESDQSFAGTGGNHEVERWDGETGNFTVIRYGGGIADVPPNAGNFYFYGGDSSGTNSATQFIDVSNCRTQIDDGMQSFSVNGYFGGFENQNDRADLNITFLDNFDQTLGTATVGGVTPADRNNITTMLYRNSFGMIPAGTRTIQAVLVMTRFDGSNNNGYADNLQFMLTAPTAASVTVGGKVLSPNGRGVSRVVVYLTDSNGNSRTAMTNNFGYYFFNEVEVGETYIFNAYSKQFQFQTRVVTIEDSVRNLNIQAK